MLRVVGGTEHGGRDADVAIIIPARYGSTRFPGKPLVELRGAEGSAKSLLQRSWETACLVSGAGEVWIATDDVRIQEAAARFGASVVLTPTDCLNGTERCCAAVVAAGLKADLIINFQGDAPLTPPLAVDALIETMREDPTIGVGTVMVRSSSVEADCLRTDERVGRFRMTSVVFDRRLNALYFSKRVIPHVGARMDRPPVYLHLEVYGYRRETLLAYRDLEPSEFEQAEGLEQLRFLDAGIPVRMVEVGAPPGGIWEVNSPSDVVAVEAALTERHID
ncbi:3-deoxy-manno-octulosonate cytidylyltransferase (CMP-KDO synthetase) [Hephaestia caeni]|uniref:3-deoxy-manno-octulosonate cytidylyltransferase (CMP-KDO synthetase) n=2 Tax=Hephaestia caeni TaxID=645617 RepID=A0A397PBM2_9SPHN|nr:3-deoxy-manno-octulosonate cytidylyltransferase (CMP-KDO synthetase) [Hephaestia caeni]